MCLLRSQKHFNSVFYTAVYYDARLQTNSYNCLSYYTNNLANNGFATFSKTVIIIFIKSLIIHEENTKEITTVAEVSNRQEICVDLYINFNFDFLALEKVYFKNNFANQLRRSFVL